MNILIFPIVTLLLVVVAVIAIKFFLEKPKEEKPMPYVAKKYFFSRSEQEFFRVLSESLDRERYAIFPKVRLADFVEVAVKGKEYWSWWNKIKSKHIDFLVWDIREQKIALAIELDGKSHQSEKMKKRDGFVEKMYERVDIKLERMVVGSDFASEINKIIKLLNI